MENITFHNPFDCHFIQCKRIFLLLSRRSFYCVRVFACSSFIDSAPSPSPETIHSHQINVFMHVVYIFYSPMEWRHRVRTQHAHTQHNIMIRFGVALTMCTYNIQAAVCHPHPSTCATVAGAMLMVLLLFCHSLCIRCIVLWSSHIEKESIYGSDTERRK